MSEWMDGDGGFLECSFSGGMAGEWVLRHSGKLLANYHIKHYSCVVIEQYISELMHNGILPGYLPNDGTPHYHDRLHVLVSSHPISSLHVARAIHV